MNKNDIRVTYAVDVQTVSAVEELASEWGVSKSEAMRRAVRLARERIDTQVARMSPSEVLAYCAEQPTRSAQEIDRWQQEARSLRRSWGDQS